MLESDGIDDVTVLVNTSPSKMMGVNISYANGFPLMSNAVLCAKASMLLQVRILNVLHMCSIRAKYLQNLKTIFLLKFRFAKRIMFCQFCKSKKLLL